VRHFLDNWLTDGGDVVSLMRQPPLPKEDSMSLFLIEFESTIKLEGLGELKYPVTSGIKLSSL
jgi:hypothetical protein